MVVVLVAAVLTREMERVENIAISFQLSGEDSARYSAPIRVAKVLYHDLEGVLWLEIGKEIDVVLEDLRQIDNLLGRESCLRAAFIKASLDRPSNNSSLAHERDL